MAEQTTNFTIVPPRADLNTNDFGSLVYQKGRKVIFEKALQCPCKSPDTNQQSNCKNCGGVGWIHINPAETRMIITGVAITNDVKAWSEEARGMIRVTCLDTEELTFMDKLTLVDGNAIFQEVVFFKKSGGKWFCWSAYPIKKVLYAGLFISTQEVLQRLDSSSFTFVNQNLILLDPDLVTDPDATSIAITLRYLHAPIYYVMEMTRETMQSYKYQVGAEVNQNFPLSAMARRSHYILTAPILNGERLLDNSYAEINCSPEAGCVLPIQVLGDNNNAFSGGDNPDEVVGL